MISLAALTSRDAEVEAELDWYFNESEGQLGLSSNYSAMVAQIQLCRGRSGPKVVAAYEIDGRLIAQATRARIISRTLEACGHHAEVLRAWASPPPGCLEELGELAGVVVAARRAGFVGSDPVTATSLLAQLCRTNPALRQQVLRDAELMRREAFRTYVHHRNRRPKPLKNCSAPEEPRESQS